MKRSHDRPGKRALQRARTRQRIIEATAELHEEVGPAATTISAVAERAGVQRLTVYRHFSDDAALFAACSAHTGAKYPPPDPALWSRIEAPGERLETALRALYTYYAEREQALVKVLRDAERLPALEDALAPMRDYMERVAEGLSAGWRVEPQAEQSFRPAVAHALEFWTWRSLAAQGLDTAEAADLMVRFICVAAEARHTA